MNNFKSHYPDFDTLLFSDEFDKIDLNNKKVQIIIIDWIKRKFQVNGSIELWRIEPIEYFITEFYHIPDKTVEQELINQIL